MYVFVCVRACVRTLYFQYADCVLYFVLHKVSRKAFYTESKMSSY